MKYNASFLQSCAYVSLGLILAGVNTARADAQLVNFESPYRVAGRYEILFKKPSELKVLSLRSPGAASGASRFVALPDTLPLTREAVNNLAQGLAKTVNGQVGTVMESMDTEDLPALFTVKGVSDETIKSLAKDPRIALISASVRTTLDTSQQTLNDPLGLDSVDYLWHLDRIDQVMGPPNGSYVYYANGYNVNAWVLDSGIFYDHHDFLTNRVRLAYDCTSGTCVMGVPNCGLNPAQEDEDPFGHGTAVASVIGGLVHGVAKQVNLISLKVAGSCSTTDGSGSSDTAVAALNFVVANKNAFGNSDIINMSFGYFPLQPALDSAVKFAIMHGITVVASAGNDGADACTRSPGDINAQAGGYPGFIVAGASTRNDQMDPMYNYGKCVSIFAPGRTVLTAAAPWGGVCGAGCARNTNPPYNTDSEGFLNGTSFSAPIVTGIGALYLQTHPNATPAQVKSAILGAASANVLFNNLNNSPNLLANVCVPGNNAALDPNAAGCAGGSGGGVPRARKAAVSEIVNVVVLNVGS